MSTADQSPAPGTRAPAEVLPDAAGQSSASARGAGQGHADADADVGGAAQGRSDADAAADAAAQARAEAAAYTAQRRQERQRASWQSMVLSLAVVLGIVLVLLALVPRVNSVTQPPLDVGPAVAPASRELGFTPSLPQGLPEGWRATSVRVTRSTADVLMWHVGYQTPSQQYAAVQQGRDAPADWVRQQVNRAPQVGTERVGGQSWVRYIRTDKLQNSLVLRNGRLTTIVTGTAGFDELAFLASRLQPAP